MPGSHIMCRSSFARRLTQRKTSRMKPGNKKPIGPFVRTVSPEKKKARM